MRRQLLVTAIGRPRSPAVAPAVTPTPLSQARINCLVSLKSQERCSVQFLSEECENNEVNVAPRLLWRRYAGRAPAERAAGPRVSLVSLLWCPELDRSSCSICPSACVRTRWKACWGRTCPPPAPSSTRQSSCTTEGRSDARRSVSWALFPN